MAIPSGNYIVRLHVQGQIVGGGVVTMRDGILFGGDSITLYRGSYHEENGEDVAVLRVNVHTKVAGMEPIFRQDNATVEARGHLKDGKGMLRATSPQAPGVNLAIEMSAVS